MQSFQYQDAKTVDDADHGVEGVEEAPFFGHNAAAECD